MKVLVLFLDNSFGPWHEMYQRGAFKTWCNPSNSDIICRSFMGQDSKWPFLNRIANRFLVSSWLSNYWNLFQSRKDLKKVPVSELDGVIRVDLPELWCNITLKTIAAIKFALDNYEFDFLLRANSTCYLDLDSLEHHLSKKSDDVLYAGPIAKGKEFVSGWGILLNRKAVHMLTTNYSLSDQKYFDDEAIGIILQRLKIIPHEIPFLEFFSEQDLNQMSSEEILKTPFFRIKFTQNGNRTDDILMGALHRRVRSLAKP